MKKLHTLTLLFLSVFILSCSDDNASIDNAPAQKAEFKTLLNGDTYTDYSFTTSFYDIISDNETLKIDTSDTNGEQITIFLNQTGGFTSGTIKEMGNVDSENFTTYILIRQSQPQISYYSSNGSVTITNNRTHPTEPGHSLISGDFSITAISVDGVNSLTSTGAFTELDYVN